MTCHEINGEALTWWVDSRSEPGKQHRVCWLSVTPTCTCNDWAMRQRAHKANGTPYLCAHLKAARDHCWGLMCEDIREARLAQ